MEHGVVFGIENLPSLIRLLIMNGKGTPHLYGRRSNPFTSPVRAEMKTKNMILPAQSIITTTDLVTMKSLL